MQIMDTMPLELVGGGCKTYLQTHAELTFKVLMMMMVTVGHTSPVKLYAVLARPIAKQLITFASQG